MTLPTKNINLYPFRDYKDSNNNSYNDEPRRSVAKLLTSSLPLYVLRWMILYVINAGVWVLLLEEGAINEPEERVLIFTTSLDLIGFALGLIYWLWVRQGLERMFKKAEVYESLLAHVESFARRVVQLLPKHIMHKLKVRCEEELRAVCVTIEEMELLLCASIRSFTFVMLNDPINMKHPKRHSIDDLCLTESLRQELSDYAPTNELEISQYLSIMIEQRIKQLSDWCVVEGGSSSLFNDAEAVSKELRSIRTNREKQGYEYINLFMISALSIVLFFFPYLIWPHARLYTLLVYPILMYVITGLPLAIVWYGDPFEGTAGDNAIDYRCKERRSCNRVYDSFERYYRNSDCKLCMDCDDDDGVEF